MKSTSAIMKHDVDLLEIIQELFYIKKEGKRAFEPLKRADRS